MPLTNFPYGVSSFGVPVMSGMPLPFTGDYWFVDPLHGSDSFEGNQPTRAFKTLYRAQAAATADQNDVVILMGSGDTTGTARLSLANAQSVDPTATTGVLTWAKNGVHLIGVTAPTGISQRARIAPPSGTYTQATFNSGNFVVVTASGCLFANFSVFHGFSTGGTNQIAWTDSGGRNAYVNVNLQGAGDAASAADTGSHSLLISAGGENLFSGCTIGLDTTPRSSGFSEIAFSGASPRNVFDRCIVETNAAAVGCFWISIATLGIDRYVLFRDTAFTNPTLGGPAATAMTVGMNIPASPGGAVITQNCLSYGATKLTTGGLAVTNLPASAAGGGLVTAIT
jgi:hypothetical protein